VQTALSPEVVAVDDYLAGEESSEVKHEYIGGVVYAMAGATIEHNHIAQNVAFAARSHLKGKACRVYISDVKVRLETLTDDVFYYPDVMVGCDPRDTDRHFLRHPKLIVEVSSPSTERLDRREKRLAYQSIQTLEEYLIVSQDRLEATLFRHANNWTPEIFNRPDQSLTLPSIGLVLALSSIYEGVAIAPPPLK
jgi:Uma2 family endonuclease